MPFAQPFHIVSRFYMIQIRLALLAEGIREEDFQENNAWYLSNI